MDKELEKIAGAMRRFDELYEFMLRGNFSAGDYRRMKKYIRNRKSWLFEWFNED